MYGIQRYSGLESGDGHEVYCQIPGGNRQQSQHVFGGVHKVEVPMEISPRWLNAGNICESIETSEFSYALPVSVKLITINKDDTGKKRKADQDMAKGRKVLN